MTNGLLEIEGPSHHFYQNGPIKKINFDCLHPTINDRKNTWCYRHRYSRVTSCSGPEHSMAEKVEDLILTLICTVPAIEII